MPIEPASKEELEPFGRQPLSVVVTFHGKDQRDVDYWMRTFMQRAEASGDMVQKLSHFHFIIHPRAVND